MRVNHQAAAILRYPVAERLLGDSQIVDLLLSAVKSIDEQPTYLYVQKILTENVLQLQGIYGDDSVLYSVKANPSELILRHLASLGLGADVASLGELDLALRCGISAANIQYSTPGKSDAELSYLLDANLGVTVLDSERELCALMRLGHKDQKSKVGLRVNLTQTHMHSVEKMSGGASQFGIDDDYALRLFQNNKQLPALTHLHMYAGSQALRAEDINNHIKNAIDFAGAFQGITKQSINSVNVGGGFGVPNRRDQGMLNFAVLKTIQKRLEMEAQKGRRIYVESGRYLVANCGLYVSQIIDIKVSNDVTYVILNGGLHHFMRPVFMCETHPLVCLTKLQEKEVAVYTVVGRLCTPMDCFVQKVFLPRLDVGDVIAIMNAGAYGWSMSPSNFLSHPYPAEILL